MGLGSEDRPWDVGKHKSLPEGWGRDGPKDGKERLLMLTQGMEGAAGLSLSGFVVGDVAQAVFEPTESPSLSLTGACVTRYVSPPQFRSEF